MNDLIDFYHIDANELSYDKDRRILFFNRSNSAENERDNEEVISSEYVNSYTDTPILRVKIRTPKTPDSLITRIEYRNDSFFYYKYATTAIVKTNFAKNKEGKVIQIDSTSYKTVLDTVLHL